MLRGDADLDPTLEEGSQFDTGAGLITEPAPVAYNPAIPIETFDVIFTDRAPYERVKKFRLLPVDLTQESGDLTPTLKLKRKVVAERYAALIAEMYDEPNVRQASG